MQELIRINKEGKVAVIDLTVRRLDAMIAPAFRDAVVDIVNAGDTRLVLNFDAVDFVDSSGLGAMVSILKTIGGRGSIAVCNVKGGVLNLFKLTRMDKVFSLYPSTQEAVARMAG